MIINVCVGDSSGDGHEKSREYRFETNATSEEQIREAWKAGAKVLGFDITDYCDDYQDNEIPTEHALKLQDEFLYDEVDPSRKRHGISADEFAYIWAHMVKLGDPSLTMEVVEGELSFDIGGYGFFY